MTVTVLTTWSKAQSETYGRAWLEGSQKWPTAWERRVYGEWPGTAPLVNTVFLGERTLDVDMLTDWGVYRIPPLGVDGHHPYPCWRGHEIAAGYSFRTDARRFAWKVYALLHAARELPTGTLVWLDADVRTRSAPPENLWDLVSPRDLGWLDRPGAWVETGCLVIRLPMAVPFIDELERVYGDPEVLYGHEQWHDGWIVTQVLRTVLRRPNRMIAAPIATKPPGVRGDVWDHSPLLSRYFSHEKGFERKRSAYGEDIIDDVVIRNAIRPIA